MVGRGLVLREAQVTGAANPHGSHEHVPVLLRLTLERDCREIRSGVKTVQLFKLDLLWEPSKQTVLKGTDLEPPYLVLPLFENPHQRKGRLTVSHFG